MSSKQNRGKAQKGRKEATKSSSPEVLPSKVEPTPVPMAPIDVAAPASEEAILTSALSALYQEEPATVEESSEVKVAPEVVPAVSSSKPPEPSTQVDRAAPEPVVAKGVLMLQSRFDGVYTYVKDGFLYVFGKVNDSYICIKVKEQALASYGVIKGKTLDVTQLVKAKSVVMYDLTQQRALELYRQLQSIAQKVPVPLFVKNGAAFVLNQGTTVAVFVKGRSMYVQGKIGNAVLAVKVRSTDTLDVAKTKALATYNSVAQKAKPYLLQAQDGLTSVKGKIEGNVVAIKARGQSKALDACNEIRAVIERLPLTSKIRDGMTVVKGKFGDITVYVKDGYMYGVSQVGDAVYFVKAKVAKAQDAAKVKVLEACSRTRDMSNDLTKYILSLADATKARADKKPVTAGATCGAMLGGASGGAVGGVAGTIAGGMAGVPLALFTLGLSIPVGAVLGGGLGASAGAVTGGAAGVVTGGTAGYGYGHREEIKTGMQNTLAKAGSAGATIQGKVMNQVEIVKERLVSGTGSTA